MISLNDSQLNSLQHLYEKSLDEIIEEQIIMTKLRGYGDLPLHDESIQRVNDYFKIALVRARVLLEMARLVGNPTSDDYFQLSKDSLLKASFKVKVFMSTCWSLGDVEICDMEKPQVKGHFYRIEDSDGKLRGYLMGTVHLIDRSLMDMNEEINRAVAKADYLFLEIKEMHLVKEFHQGLIDHVLKKQPKEEIKKALQAYAEIFDVHLTAAMWEALEEKQLYLDTLRSFIMAYEIAIHISRGSFVDADEVIGVDGWIHHQFAKAEKPIFGLESADEHFKLICEMSPPDERKEFLKPNPICYCEDLSVCDEWRRGDILKSDLSLHQEGTIGYKLKDMRDEQFGEVIYKDIMLNQKIGIYAFGSAHLYGNKGVIQSLEGRNLKVIRIGQ